jgi:peptidyl-prolyl cis-trans isomerase C
VIKKILSALMLLGLTTAVNAQMFGPIATVNGVEISRSKLQAQVNHTINQRGMGSGGITQPGTYKNIQEEVLKQLIVQELLWQEAQRRDFIVSDAEVDERLDEMKSSFETEQAFLFKIKEGGFTEASFREEIRQQRSAQRMVAEGISAGIAISDEDVEKFYNENIDSMSSPEEVRARHILVSPKSDDEEGERLAREEIGAIQEELEGGASFALVAMERSEGPSANQGGDLGFFGRGQMVPAFEEVAFALRPGEISEVVETQFGYHIIKLEERREAQTVPVEEAAERISAYLTQNKLQEAVEDLVDDLHTAATIENTLMP